MSNTLVVPESRVRWMQVEDGRFLITKHQDSTEIYKIDFIERLQGATISSLTSATGQGVTVSASAIATGRDNTNNTAISLTIAKTDGYVTLTFVTSDSQTLVYEVLFRGTPQAEPESDYRG